MTLMPRAGLHDHPLFRDIGIEPLGNELDGAAAGAACSRARRRR